MNYDDNNTLIRENKKKKICKAIIEVKEPSGKKWD